MARKPQGEMGFCIRVLWLHGASIGKIAISTRSNKGAVRGIVHRSFDVVRDVMTIEERQAKLDAMKADRMDGGILPDKFFVAMPLAPMQAAKSKGTGPGIQPLGYYMKPKETPEALPPPDMRTREGRKEAQRRRRDAERLARKKADEQAAREMGGATERGIRADAVGYLKSIGALSDRGDYGTASAKIGVISSRERRWEAGRILREMIDGCRIGGLNGIDYGRVSASSGAGISLSAKRLECISELGAIRQMMSVEDYRLIEAVVDRDDFIWETVPEKEPVFEAIRRTLDIVAAYRRLMARDTFKERWGYELPLRGELKVLEREDAVEITQKARKIISDAQREAR